MSSEKNDNDPLNFNVDDDPFLAELRDGADAFSLASQPNSTYDTIKVASATVNPHLAPLAPPVVSSSPPSITNGKIALTLKPNASSAEKAGDALVSSIDKDVRKTILASVEITRGAKAAAAANSIQMTSDLAVSRPVAVKEAAKGSTLGAPLDQDLPKNLSVKPAAVTSAATPPPPIPKVSSTSTPPVKPVPGNIVRDTGFKRLDSAPGKPPAKPASATIDANKPSTPAFKPAVPSTSSTTLASKQQTHTPPAAAAAAAAASASASAEKKPVVDVVTPPPTTASALITEKKPESISTTEIKSPAPAPVPIPAVVPKQIPPAAPVQPASELRQTTLLEILRPGSITPPIPQDDSSSAAEEEEEEEKDDDKPSQDIQMKDENKSEDSPSETEQKDENPPKKEEMVIKKEEKKHKKHHHHSHSSTGKSDDDKQKVKKKEDEKKEQKHKSHHRHHHHHSKDEEKEKKHKKHHSSHRHSHSHSHSKKKKKKDEQKISTKEDGDEKYERKRNKNPLLDDEAEESDIADEAQEGEEEERSHASSEPSQADDVESTAEERAAREKKLVSDVSRDPKDEVSDYERDGFIVNDNEIVYKKGKRGEEIHGRAQYSSDDSEDGEDDILPADEPDAVHTGDEEDVPFNPDKAFSGNNNKKKPLKRLKRTNNLIMGDDDELEQSLEEESRKIQQSRIKVDLTKEESDQEETKEKQKKEDKKESSNEHKKHKKHHHSSNHHDSKKREKPKSNDGGDSSSESEKKKQPSKKKQKNEDDFSDNELIGHTFASSDEPAIPKQIVPIRNTKKIDDKSLIVKLSGSMIDYTGKPASQDFIDILMMKIITASIGHIFISHSTIDPRDDKSSHPLFSDFELWMKACSDGECAKGLLEQANVFRMYFGFETKYPIQAGIDTLNAYALRVLDRITSGGRLPRKIFESALNPRSKFHLTKDEKKFDMIEKQQQLKDDGKSSAANQDDRIEITLKCSIPGQMKDEIVLQGPCKFNFVTQLITVIFSHRPLSALEELIIDYAKTRRNAKLDDSGNFRPNFINKIVTAQHEVSKFQDCYGKKLDKYRNDLLDTHVMIKSIVTRINA